MPIYEYECSECGEIEEAVQKISDTPLVECRRCSGRLHKIISQSAFHLKGGGWYADAYSSKSGKGTEKGGSGAAVDTPKESKAPVKAESGD